MLVNRTPTAEAQRRSMSDSESDRISSAVRLMGPNKDSDNLIQSPPLRNNVNLEFTRSNPNIFPLGVGLGTGFQARNNPRLLEQQEKAEKMCRKLMKDLDIRIWRRSRMCFTMITPLSPPLLPVIIFKQRQITYQLLNPPVLNLNQRRRLQPPKNKSTVY